MDISTFNYLLELLGYQGGTVHQVKNEIEKIVEDKKQIEETLCSVCDGKGKTGTYDDMFPCWNCEGHGYTISWKKRI